MRVGRRRVAVVATVLVALAAGTGVARAYYAPGAQDRRASRRATSPSAPTASATSPASRPPTSRARPTAARLHASTTTSTTSPGRSSAGPSRVDRHFVLGKSGIESNRRRRGPPCVTYDQRIEYADEHAPDARRSRSAARCARASRSIRPETEKQRFDGGDPVLRPVGLRRRRRRRARRRSAASSRTSIVADGVELVDRRRRPAVPLGGVRGRTNVTGLRDPAVVIGPDVGPLLRTNARRQPVDRRDEKDRRYQPATGRLGRRSGPEIRSASQRAEYGPLNPIGDRIARRLLLHVRRARVPRRQSSSGTGDV